MAWRVARSLDVLKAEIDKEFPNRSTISDGSIGDAAHASRESDHNPWVVVDGIGIVRARDFTHDPDGGLDCWQLAPKLASLIGKHPALGSGGYVIWQRKIISYDRRSEGWRTYTGSNPHDRHLHISVALRQSGFDSTQPWNIYTEEDDMNAAQDQRLKDVQAAVNALRKDFDTFRTNEVRRDDATRERLRKLLAQGTVTREQLEELLAD